MALRKNIAIQEDKQKLKTQQNVTDKTFTKIFTKKDVETTYSFTKAERSIPKSKKINSGGGGKPYPIQYSYAQLKQKVRKKFVATEMKIQL